MTILAALLASALLLSPTGDVDPDAGVELSLLQAIEEAFANNLALKGALLQAESSMQGFNAAWGDFDTTFFANATQSEDVNPPTPTTFIGSLPAPGTPKSETDIFSLNTGFRGQLQTGTTWDLSMFAQNRETENRTKPTSTKSETYVANWRLSVTHPLLKGGDDYATSGIRLAAQDVRIASLDAEVTANDTIALVVTAYWNLVFAQQNAETRDLSVELARDLLDITRRKFDQGLQNRIDVIEVEAELALRIEEQLTAHNQLDQSMDDLREMTFAPQHQSGWSGTILPVTDYTVLPDEVPSTEVAIMLAMERRPDVVRARMAVERAEIEIERAENQTDPTLNLTGQYGVNAQNRNFGKTAQDLDDTSHHNLELALAFEMPLGNRGAGYTLRRRQVDRERAVVSKAEAELNAIAEVRQTSRDVTLQRARVVATAETTRLRREVYDGEKRRLENDLSTPFQVREAQRDLLTAIDSELRARLDLAVAHTTYRAAQGTLLDRFGYSRFDPDVSLDAAPPAWDG
ncbi:MAG: hypothetical protein DRQ55_08195 [Planctomycetota bacterium]|nr:MAG: hypothetical protein DRQ55_08195 [Planctomycetota bacterium]